MNASILRELSVILREEVKDPQVKTCTITDVVCSEDLAYAKIYVTFMKNTGKGLQALERSKGYIRSRLAKKLKIRKCPELQFKLDESLEYGNHIEEILKSLKREDM